jgi:hypothetical protein
VSTPIQKERGGRVVYEPDNEWRPEYARWVDDKYPPRYMPMRGQGQLFNPNQTLPAFTKVTTGMTLLGLLYAIDHWARPVLKATRGKPAGGFLSLVFWTVQRVVTLLNPQVRHVARDVSKGAAHTSSSPAAVLGRLARRWEQLSWNLAYLYWELGLVLPRIVHVKVPQMIRVKTVPIIIRVKKLQVGVIRLTTKTTTLEHWQKQVIRLRIKVRLGRLDKEVFVRVPLRIGRAQRTATRADRKATAAQRGVRHLSWLLPFAGAVPLFYNMLRRTGNNWIRCRNVKRVGKRLCGMSSSDLDDLLGSLLGILGTVSLIEFVRDGQAIEREAIDALRFFIRDTP